MRLALVVPQPIAEGNPEEYEGNPNNKQQDSLPEVHQSSNRTGSLSP